MQSRLTKLFLKLARLRFAWLALIVAGAAVFFVNELTYLNSTARLRSGIALTEERLKAAELVQSLNELDVMRLSFVMTGKDEYRLEYVVLEKELKTLQQHVNAFFADQGHQSAKTAGQISEFFNRKLDTSNAVMALARSGDRSASMLLEQSLSFDENKRFNKLLTAAIDHAASVQGQVRVSIYDALWLNRIVVSVLTLLIMASLLVLGRQLLRHEKERRHEQDRLEQKVKERTAQLREVALHLQSVREEERNHLARELHDELGGILTVCKLELARARGKAQGMTDMLIRLDNAIVCVNKGIALKRQIIENLSPSALTHLGLKAALEITCREMGENIGVPISLTTDEPDLRSHAALMAYRFVQEALTNAAKYAEAQSVSVVLRTTDQTVSISVQDDGKGFDVNASRVGHHGIAGMQFRAESLGGVFTLQSSPGRGTTISMEFSLAQQVDANTDSIISSMPAELQEELQLPKLVQS